ncbi:holo-[acyl-carrier-protein] synthase [Verrucomicrobiota bacterium]|nr:holo-[acyl-carrier-protein] synthase [Verrucomicrobiota bacterium]
MILGTGIDLIEIARIKSSHDKFGERFLNRILLPGEIFYCLSYKNPAPYIAARFAAKEAISKAFGTGIGSELTWHDMEIARHPSGAPHVILHDGGLRLLRERRAARLHLSLSHTEQYATAMAILEADGPLPEIVF